jgi:hypothetical protein
MNYVSGKRNSTYLFLGTKISSGQRCISIVFGDHVSNMVQEYARRYATKPIYPLVGMFSDPKDSPCTSPAPTILTS